MTDTNTDARDVVDLEALERAARDCDGEAWGLREKNPYCVETVDGDYPGFPVVDDAETLSIAAFIALANPATVLHLISRAKAADAAEAALKTAVGTADWMLRHNGADQHTASTIGLLVDPIRALLTERPAQ